MKSIREVLIDQFVGDKYIVYPVEFTSGQSGIKTVEYYFELALARFYATPSNNINFNKRLLEVESAEIVDIECICDFEEGYSFWAVCEIGDDITTRIEMNYK